MLSSRQRVYLDAMDIGVWILRSQPASAPPGLASTTNSPPGLKLGPGGGGILLICAADTDSASRLANDIGRALGSVPVWSWPDADADTVKLPAAIEENLFTTVAIFGTGLAMEFFDGELPVAVGSANLLVLPSMQDLQNRADARRELWATLCRSGIVTRN